MAGKWVGREVAGRLVVALVGRTAKRESVYRVRCLACGTEDDVQSQNLRRGNGCRRCENAAKGAAGWGPTDGGRAHAKTLTAARWPRVCLTCRAAFLGTARQKYCTPAHRPSEAKRAGGADRRPAPHEETTMTPARDPHGMPMRADVEAADPTG